MQYEPYRNRLSRLTTSIPSSCTLQQIDYTYDGVGNITRMDQTQPSCGGLGGTYRNDYTYDYQYRLTQAECNAGAFQYDFRANYSLAGRLGHSSCGNTGVMDVDMIYGYDNHRWTHQPRVVYDSETSTRMSLCWDANGNLFHVQDCAGKRGRFHDWDEENRLRMVIGSKNAGYYGYDANGERVYKLTGESSIDFLGQGIADATVQFDDAVLYPNPYLTVTSQGYTKHYYANGERLASVIGHGGWYAMSSDPIDLPSPEEKDKQELIKTQYDYTYPLDRKDVYSITDHNEDIEGVEQDEIQYDCDCNQLRWISVAWEPDLLYLTMDANTHPNGYPEDEIYYTHSDHLGSSAWITDSYADPIQYLHYLPYGELLANKQRTTYDERYKFIGKERDLESGYDYFGARYYIPSFLHFASVEPLLDKYLHISPYSYAAWNPIKNVDVNGFFSLQNIDENTDYKTILVLPSLEGMTGMSYKEKQVFNTSRQQAENNGMPMMFIDNTEDYKNAMNALTDMGSSTDSYVLATSHGYRSKGVCAIRIGTDVFSEKSGDFSQLETGLKNKIVFSTACKLTGINSGISLIERMARETGATIIGSDYSIPGLLGFHGNDLNMSPIRNFIVGLFGGNFENSFKMTNGYTTQTIYNLTIDKNMGIRWNAGNKNIFSR